MLLRALISSLCMLLIISAFLSLLAFSSRSTKKSITEAEQYIERANGRAENGLE